MKTYTVTINNSWDVPGERINGRLIAPGSPMSDKEFAARMLNVRDEIEAALKLHGGKIVTTMPIIGAFSVETTQAGMGTIKNVPHVLSVIEDQPHWHAASPQPG